jgi:hypothetical protein
MRTQNAKRMTTWMGSRYMGRSHGQPFRQDTAPLIGLHLPMGFRDAVAFSLGEKQRQSSGTASNGGLPRYAQL